METASASDSSDSFTKFVNLMEKNMNLDVDPCEDFLSYASGSFSKDNYNENQGEICPGHYENSLERVLKNEMIDCDLIRKVRDFQNSIPTSAKTLLENEGLREFCGGFPAFHNNWSAENFHWIRAAAMLSAMGVDTVLYCYLQYLNNTRIISVRPIIIAQYWIENAATILNSLELNNEQVWDIINDVNIIREKLNGIQVNYETGYQHERVRRLFEELRMEAFDYQTYFETLFGQPLDPEDVFYLNNYEPGYMDRYLNIFLETPAKVVANYFTFLAAYSINEYDPFLLTEQNFGPVFLAVGLNFYSNSFEMRKRTDMFTYFTKFSKKEIHAEDDALASVHVDRDEAVLEFINSNLNYEKVKEEFENLEISPNNFFQNIQNMKRLCTPTSMRRYLSYREEDSDLLYKARQLLAFLQLHHNKPMFYYFSGWAETKWRDLISNTNFEDLIENCSKVENCIRGQLRNFDFPQFEEFAGYSLEHIWREYLISIEGLNVAFRSYTSWLADNEELAKKENDTLKRLNLDCRKAFFVSFVQHSCHDVNVPYIDVHMALVNSEFAEVFSCKPKSRMFLNNKCEIKWNKRKSP